MTPEMVLTIILSAISAASSSYVTAFMMGKKFGSLLAVDVADSRYVKKDEAAFMPRALAESLFIRRDEHQFLTHTIADVTFVRKEYLEILVRHLEGETKEVKESLGEMRRVMIDTRNILLGRAGSRFDDHNETKG